MKTIINRALIVSVFMAAVIAIAYAQQVVSGTVTVNQGTAGASNWPVIATPQILTSTGTGWTSGTAGNTTQSLMSSGGWPALLVQLNQTSTISGGAVTFEGTYDG